MSTPLICSALGLSPDRWPPDYYALLGLAAGAVDAAAVEERVLDRMDRLRRYQLTQPDAVTDAMNRLAQALVCLTDPAAKAAYDASLRPAPAAVGVQESPADEAFTLAPPQAESAAPVVRIAARGPVRPAAADARRERCRQRAATRRLRAAWREVGRFLTQPGRRLEPAEAIDFIAALLDLRDRLADPSTPLTIRPGEPGAVVGALACQPLPLTTFRHLLPDQREALIADWRAGEARIADLHARLGVRRRRGGRRRAVRRFARAITTDRFDLAMFVLGLAALVIALLRTR